MSETSTLEQAQRLFSVTVNGQVIARITDNQSSQNSATLYCGEIPTDLTFSGRRGRLSAAVVARRAALHGRRSPVGIAFRPPPAAQRVGP